MSVTKFAVIIPFRPKVESTDWERDSKLLEQTVTSVLKQTYASFKIFVIITNEPSIKQTNDRVTYITFPYGHQAYNEIPIREELSEKFKSEKMVVRRWDKARKLTYGSKLAKEEGYDYIMALDADDLLSRYLFAKLADSSDNGKCPGWYMEKGFVYKQPTRYFIKVPKAMRFLNGSTHILRADLVHIPDFSSTNWLDYSLFTDHGWIKDRVKNYMNVELCPVDRAMLVYVVHESNISKIDAKEYGLGLKTIFKRIIRFVPLTKRLREEFSIVPFSLSYIMLLPYF